jgi:uroporphyrinogen-III synthase
MPERAATGPVVILTRSAERNAPLRAELEARGMTVLDLPCFRTEPVSDTAGVARAITALTERDLLVLTSAAAPTAIARIVDPSRLRAPVAAIGGATAAAARSVGLRVTFVATGPDGATLAQELPIPPGEVVLARSDRAARELPEILARRGARVRELETYRTVAGVTGDTAPTERAVEDGTAVVVLASPSAVEGLLGAIPVDRAKRARFVAIGPTTAAAIRDRAGVEPLVAPGPDVGSLVGAVLQATRSEVPA